MTGIRTFGIDISEYSLKIDWAKVIAHPVHFVLARASYISLKNGKISEKKVSWSFQSEYEGNPLTLKYSGTLESATKMTGTVSVDPYGVDGEFTAVPAK